MLLIRGVSQTITQGGNISFLNSPFRDLADEGLGVGAGINVPYPVLMCLGVVVVGTYWLHFTVFGRHLYAIGGNREAAEYSGVPVKRVETLAYVISAGLAGLAGIAYAAYVGQMSHTVGEAYELYAITAAVLGGCSLRGGEGTVAGVIIGAAIMRIMDNGINMFQIPYTDMVDGNEVQKSWRLNENWRNIINGGVILGAVLAGGLPRRRRRRRGGAPPERSFESPPCAPELGAPPAACAPEPGVAGPGVAEPGVAGPGAPPAACAPCSAPCREEPPPRRFLCLPRCEPDPFPCSPPGPPLPLASGLGEALALARA